MEKSYPFYQWLETHWVTPAYAGGLLMVIALCFFGAATNTMAGWLYVLSGMIIALLILGAILPWRSLRFLQIRRLPLVPVGAGDHLTVEIEVVNPRSVPIALVELGDYVPYVLHSSPPTTAIEWIPPHHTYLWTYYLPATKRGIYRWQDLYVRSGSPLGLFWCRRARQASAKAIVYPQVLPLHQSPIIDTLSQENNLRLQSDHHYQAANEGLTKTLRPYRYGDATRLIHWRSSARFEEFKVRELEVVTGSEDIIIGLDSQSAWEIEAFEQGVIAAASLYFYALRCQLNAKLWTAGTGIIQGNRVVLETLAGIMPEEELNAFPFPQSALIWLTQNSTTLETLPRGSRWVIFPHSQKDLSIIPTKKRQGLVLSPEESLVSQLQQRLK